MLQKLFIAFLLLLVNPLVTLADTGTAGGAAPVLRFGTGARAFAMGGAYVAIVDDPTAVYWNPAGLARLDKPGFSTMHSELYVGTRYDYLAWAMPMANSGFGINILNLSTPGIVNTEGSQTDAATRVIYAGYGRKLGNWSLGVTAKYIQEDILGTTGSGTGFDLGLQGQLCKSWYLGFMLQDVTQSNLKWETGYSEKVPLNTRIGLAYRNDSYLVIAETEKAQDYWEKHVGFEFTVNNYLKIRGGIRGSDFSTGIGIGKDIWSFDYAYCAGDLGNTHRLSFSVKFK